MLLCCILFTVYICKSSSFQSFELWVLFYSAIHLRNYFGMFYLFQEGKDVVARAKTGSGKTFAYLLPLLQKLFTDSSTKKSGPSAVVLVPTRELSQQVRLFC